MFSWDEIKHIDIHRLASPDEPDSEDIVDKYIVRTADEVVRKFGGQVTSGYRSFAHNEKVRGSPTSSHMMDKFTGRSYAVDIYIPDLEIKVIDFLKYIFQDTIITRIGYSYKKNFVHIDTSPVKVPRRLWNYDAMS